MTELRYEPDGEVLRGFLTSSARLCSIQGPWGSGKSTACGYKLLMNAMRQPRGPDGVRRRRTYVGRNTFDELKRTTVKTWLQIFPEDKFGRFAWSKPFEHRIRIGDLDWEVVFLALDDEQDRRKLLSAEISDFWGNEARELPRGVIDDIDGRINRFPSVQNGGCRQPQIILDTNAPSEDHWMAVMSGQSPIPEGMDESTRRALIKPDTWEFFLQPPGMLEVKDERGSVIGYEPNPLAENRKWLAKGYYDTLIAGKPLQWIRVNVLNKPGQLSSGKPVWPEFKEEVHSARSILSPYPGYPLIIGMDFGRSPAAVIGQQSFGRWLILNELTAENMGTRQFARLLKSFIATSYPGMAFSIFGDPAGEHLSEADDISPFLMVRAEGLRILPAPSNDIAVRLNAVREAFSQLVDGKPRVLISPSCQMLRSALNGGYRYRKLQTSGDRYSDVPEKDRFSHVCDALQYLMIGAGEGRAILNQGMSKVHVAPPPQPIFRRFASLKRKIRGW